MYSHFVTIEDTKISQIWQALQQYKSKIFKSKFTIHMVINWMILYLTGKWEMQNTVKPLSHNLITHFTT